MRSPSSDQARAVHLPLSSSSFVAPAVSSADIVSTRGMIRDTSTVTSSMATKPCLPGPLMGAHGMTCFCPLSATASHQRPGFGFARKARSLCFSPLLALSYRHFPPTSHIQWE